ncbi:MAG: signal recognition particle-docking protein FtsY [Candidatus Aenigmatarchaeota archaeon]|nr:MAG: signal recognition particle-docking protein FtsY [Candidatus Aenigmarchaeota archaeon]
MFGVLKKVFKKSVKDLSKPKPEKERVLKKPLKKIVTKTISEKDIDGFFDENEIDFLQANVSLEVMDFLRERLKERLAGKEIKRGKTEDFIKQALKEVLLEVVSQKGKGFEQMIKESKKHGKPACFVFLGFNGSGKTTSIAKAAHYMMSKGFKPVLAAGDTFRAASIEQLEHHGEKLGIKVIKHQYGSDSAAVVFDAKKFAESKGYDAVLADTAGRAHTDKNLMEELSKVVRVNKPDMKILVLDSLTGNDAVEQARTFDSFVGVDAVILTKTDVDEKGGSVLSVCYAIKKPVLFLGTGQDYEDFESFEPKKFVNRLLEE